MGSQRKWGTIENPEGVGDNGGWLGMGEGKEVSDRVLGGKGALNRRGWFMGKGLAILVSKKLRGGT